MTAGSQHTGHNIIVFNLQEREEAVGVFLSLSPEFAVCLRLHRDYKSALIKKKAASYNVAINAEATTSTWLLRLCDSKQHYQEKRGSVFFDDGYVPPHLCHTVREFKNVAFKM